MKTTKKLITFVLVTMLVVSLSAVPAFAAFTNETPTKFTVAGVDASSIGTPNTDATAVTPGALSLPDDTVGLNSATVTQTGATVGAGNIEVRFKVVDSLDTPDIATNELVDSTTAVDLTNADGKFLLINLFEDDSPAYSSEGYYALEIDITSDSSTGGTLAEETVTFESDAEYVDLKVLNMVLPTSATLTFKLDPLGLMNLEEGVALDITDLEGGNIFSTNTVDVVNKSSVAVKLAVKMTGTATDADSKTNFIEAQPAVTTGTAMTAEEATLAAVQTGTDNNLLLYAIPSSVNISEQPRAAADPLPEIPEQYVASGNGYVITDTVSTLNFVLEPADYTVTLVDEDAADPEDKYDLSMVDGTGNGTGFQLGGRVNTNADWADFSGSGAAKTVGLDVVFTPTEATAQDVTDIADETKQVAGVPGLLANAANKFIAVTPVVSAPTATAESVNLSKAATGAFELPVNLAGSAIVEITQGNTASGTTGGTALTSADYTVSGNTVSLTATKAAAWKTLATGTSKFLAITFDDAADTVLVIEIKIVA